MSLSEDLTLYGLDAIKEQDIEGILKTFKRKGLDHRSIQHLFKHSLLCKFSDFSPSNYFNSHIIY